ncbi:MAG: DUF433 domain-containing protein [Moraxellaceae bacterium]|nr:DUF433 domain-containing protein [Pseudomonadales bacterium]MCP5175428.1 DUF433 domain-containing protein [Moraxellaceae bacterium]MCP5175986.1 DUF433 domain-containing protein [Moraxellaceae bacterium]HQV24069.1 DUF433 domain-containing protein [Agitococcus sp.]
MERLSFFEGRIIIDPDVCNGHPIIRGKRITVQSIIEYLGAGDSQEQILAEYPFLEAEDIRACLQFASLLMSKRYDVLRVA